MRKKMVRGIATAFTVTILAGCMGIPVLAAELSPDDSTTVTLYHIYNEEIAEEFVDAAAMMQQISKFKEDYPNVEVEEIIVPDDWTQKLLTYSAAGDTPDVYMDVSGTVLRTLQKNGSCMALDEVFTKEYLERYRQDYMDTFRLDGTLYSLPLYCETGSTLVYNVELLAEAGYDSFPETWDEILEANEYFKDKGIAMFALGDQAQWIFRQCYFVTICNEFMGSEWFDEIGRKNPDVGYNNPEFIAALQRVSTLGELFNPDWKSIIDTEATNQYLEGKAVATINGNWMTSQIIYGKDDYPEVYKNSKIGRFPGETAHASCVSGGAGTGLGLSGDLENEKGSVHYNAAVKLMEYLAGEDYNIFTVENGAAPCMNVEADISELPALSVEYMEMVDEVSYIAPFDRHDIDGQLDTVLSSVLQDVASGNMTPEEGAELMQETYESVW